MTDSWLEKNIFTYYGPFGVFRADFSLILDILGQAKANITKKCPDSGTKYIYHLYISIIDFDCHVRGAPLECNIGFTIKYLGNVHAKRQVLYTI